MELCDIPKPVCTYRTKGGFCKRPDRCQPCIDKCVRDQNEDYEIRCERTLDQHGQTYCISYPDPSLLWSRPYGCPMGFHRQVRKTEIKHKLNPIKAAKRARKGR